MRYIVLALMLLGLLVCMSGLGLLVSMSGCGDNSLVAGEPIVFVPGYEDMAARISLVWFGSDFRIDLLMWRAEHPGAVIYAMIPPQDTNNTVFFNEYVTIIYGERAW